MTLAKNRFLAVVDAIRRIPRSGQFLASGGIGCILPHRDHVIVLTLLIVSGVVHGIGFDGWPARISDAKGTYIAQAYAMIYRHSIAHYSSTSESAA